MSPCYPRINMNNNLVSLSLDKSTQSNDVPCLKSALHTRSTPSSTIEVVSIICSADCNNVEEDEKGKTTSNINYNVKEKIDGRGDISSSSFDSYLNPWTHPIGKSLITIFGNGSSTSKRMDYQSKHGVSTVDSKTCSIEGSTK